MVCENDPKGRGKRCCLQTIRQERGDSPVVRERNLGWIRLLKVMAGDLYFKT